MQKNKWCVIFNPISGRGRAVKDRPQIESLLRQYNIPFEVSISEYAGHTVQITKKALGSGIKKFIAVGGDGS